jgi:phosphate transport system protein
MSSSGAPDVPPVDRQDLPEIAEPQGPVRVHFQGWLDEIDDELVGGALLVSAAVPRITRAWVAGDRAAIDETRALNADVCERVRRVEEQGFLLLAREAPVGGDLRRLVAMLRLVTSVERSAALLKHVAETLGRVEPGDLAPETRQQAEELGRRAGEVFRRGVDAWRSRDGLAVHELDDEDDGVDRLSIGLLQQADAVESPAEAMALAQLARYWERIADHGVSFAQHSTFAVTGERVEVGP